VTLPKARTPLAARYSRTIYDETGETVQYLEPLPDGTWRGWEVYDDGNESEPQTFAMDVLPIGYVAVQP
jgi:hypothetical protein